MKENPNRNDLIDNGIVGTAVFVIIGSILCIPFVGFLPLLVTMAVIVAACAVLRVMTKDEDDNQR